MPVSIMVFQENVFLSPISFYLDHIKSNSSVIAASSSLVFYNFDELGLYAFLNGSFSSANGTLSDTLSRFDGVINGNITGYILGPSTTDFNVVVAGLNMPYSEFWSNVQNGTTDNIYSAWIANGVSFYGNSSDPAAISFVDTGNGNDTIDGSDGGTTVHTYGGNDTIFGGDSFDVIWAGDGDDYVSAGAGSDTIFLEAGNDRTNPGAGDDFIYGGSGFDQVIYSGPKSNYAITVYLTGYKISSIAEGTDTIWDVEEAKFSDQIVTLVYDLSGPVLTTFSPGDEATGVAIGSNIIVTFNEAIQRGTGNIVLKTVTGTTVATYDAASSGNLSISGNTLTINPSADLANSTGYKVEFAAGTIKDLASNNYAGTSSYNFTTTAAASQVILGTSGNDTLTGTAGNDTINGLSGLDTAVYTARMAAYTISPTAISGPDGTDTLTSIERLQFSDANLAFDLDGNAGQTYRLYQASFNRTPDLAGLGGWIAAMDNGTTPIQVATSFMASAEFQSLYGANPSNEQFVSLLYTNALHRNADAGGLAYWVNQLSSNLQTRAQALVNLSESSENKASVLPAITNGIVYTNTGPANGQSFTGTTGDDSLIGSVGNDTFSTGAGNDYINAGFGNDSITAGAGNDTINGGGGLDLAIYSGPRASYSVTNIDGTLTVIGEGTDTLTNVERLQFSDGGLAFDTGGNAGQVYRLYQAAFDRTPDTAGLSGWMRGMDNGLTLQNVATGFIGSAEFQGLYGANPTDAAFVNLLYQNVLNREPDDGGKGYWLDTLDNGMTREMALIGFSESAENQAAVIGVIQGGIEFVLG